MDEKKLDDLLRKVRALRAKAESTGSEAEATAFAAKAAEMMAQYGLEEAQLRVEEQSGVEHVQGKQDWSSPSRRALAAAVCRLYMVKPIVGRERGEWILVGRKHNIVMAQEMTDYLVGATRRLSVAWRKENRETQSAMIDFRKGCFMRLTERVSEMRRQQAESEQPVYSGSNPGNLPALYKTELALANDYAHQHWNLGRGKSRNIKMGNAAEHGRRAGDGVSFNQQISGRRQGAALLGRS